MSDPVRAAASRDVVYRVQDQYGRGPWRPGFSATWLDRSDVPLPPTFCEEFGWREVDVPRMFQRDEFFGSACRTLEQLLRWFTPTERERLRSYGYSIVMMTVDRVLGESENQVVFARRRSLTRGAIVIPWPASICA